MYYLKNIYVRKDNNITLFFIAFTCSEKLSYTLSQHESFLEDNSFLDHVNIYVPDFDQMESMFFNLLLPLFIAPSHTISLAVRTREAHGKTGKQAQGKVQLGDVGIGQLGGVR